MPKKIISIIGGGAVGVSLLYQLIKKSAKNNSALKLEINIFEKKMANIGRGLAYSKDNEVNILNRPAETMSAIYGNKRHFLDWLTNNHEWKMIYPEINIDNKNDLFLPRSLFGAYLEHLFESALVIAKQKNIQINVIHDEVIDLQNNKHQHCVVTKSGNTFLSHAIVLALGHTNSNNYDYLHESGKYFESPYPTIKICNHIPKKASVAIIGSRLSAMDAAIALHESGHVGKIAFVSRNGYMPSVRPGGIFDYQLKNITQQKLDAISKSGDNNLKLKDVLNIIVEEVSLAAGSNKKISEWFDRPKDAVLYLESELSKLNCQSFIIWQSVMISINNIIELIWHKLSDRDKKIFIKRYRTRWMAYRVGIPPVNAQKILSLMKAGSLSSIRGLKSIEYDKDAEKFLVKSKLDSAISTFDYTINATGFCSDLNHTKSSVLRKMQKNGLLQVNPFGGVDIDFSTSRIKNQHGAIQKNLYIIGNLTEGAYFFTSVLELNIAHANTISDLILDGFKYQNSNRNDSSILIKTYAR